MFALPLLAELFNIPKPTKGLELFSNDILNVNKSQCLLNSGGAKSAKFIQTSLCYR